VFVLQNWSVFADARRKQLQKSEVSGLLNMDELFAPPSIPITSPVKFSTQAHIYANQLLLFILPPFGCEAEIKFGPRKQQTGTIRTDGKNQIRARYGARNINQKLRSADF
jgi:hypothetical protein